MRRASAAVALALIAVLVFSQIGIGAASSTQLKLGLPSYEKLDPDFARELVANGDQVIGKELHGGINNGKSYKSPADLGALGSLDVRGQRKGIAILVDWPTNDDGSSNVPGVNYDPVPGSLFYDLLNSTSYDPYQLEMFQHLSTFEGQPAPTDRTLRNYYTEVSFGQFQIDVDVVGWVTLRKPYSYYFTQTGVLYNDNGDAFIGELVSDAIDLAKDQGIDFSQYAVPAKPGDFIDLYGDATSFTDEDGNVIDKVVPNVFIIHRGTGAEFNLDPSIIWSHKWDILSATYYGEYFRTGMIPDESTLAYKVVDGAVVNTYNVVPEVGQDITGYYMRRFGLPPRAPSPTYVGVYAHEFGHVLGLPDQYDYGYDSEGTGVFTLMASGSWGRDIQDRYYSGNSPTHMDAWSKSYLGFIQPQVVTPEMGRQRITLRPSAQFPDAVKVVVPGSNGREYFIMENRQQLSFDRGLAYTLDGSVPHGLVVYQVDENVFQRNFHRPNEAANWSWDKRGNSFTDANTGEKHYAISVVQADGRYDLEQAYNDGDAGDPFPGRMGVTQLSPQPANKTASTVSWYDWGVDNRSITGITIDDIVENADGSVTFDLYFAD